MERTCKSGSVAARIGGVSVCLRDGLRCKARYQHAYIKKGFHCANGRLQKLPPPRQAVPGPYDLTTSQCVAPTVCNEATLTVLPGGRTFANLVLPYSADCTPANNDFGVLTTTLGTTWPLDNALGFQLSDTYTNPDGLTVTALLTGAFDTVGGVSGSVDIHVYGSDNGTFYTCNTGTVTFSGKVVSTSP